MAMRNPSTLLYMNINKNLNKEEPIKNNNKGLLTRDNNRGTNNMSKQNEATNPLESLVNNHMQIRKIRKDLNGTE